MAIYWKYLIKQYLKVFFLSILAFISILLVTRMKNIANFATIATDFKSIILFVFFQIPHILPITISVSCLISSILLFQKLSSMSELTAFRSLGISLSKLLSPLILLSFIFSFLNFYTALEIIPLCRYKSNELVYQSSTMNPIVLLQRRKKLSNIKNSYVEISSKNNDLKANDILMVIPNKANKRLCLISAKNLELEKEQLIGKNLSLISYAESNKMNNFDNLIIENQEYMITEAKDITSLIKEKISVKYKTIYDTEEIAKSIAFALSSLSFTLIGASFAISLNRKTSKKNILVAMFFSLIILISFIMGKAIKIIPLLSNIIYIAPQLIILVLTAKKLKKISRGSE